MRAGASGPEERPKVEHESRDDGGARRIGELEPLGAGGGVDLRRLGVRVREPDLGDAGPQVDRDLLVAVGSWRRSSWRS